MALGKVQERIPFDAAAAASPHGPATVAVLTTDDLLPHELAALLEGDRYRLALHGCPESVCDFLSDRYSDAVLLDLRLPTRARSEIARRLRALGRRSAVPLIGLCDADMPSEARVLALADGFWDVVELPASAAELAAKLGTWVWLKRDVDALQSETLLDAETGHYTVRGIKRRLRELIALVHRTNDALSCVVFGVDRVPDGVHVDAGAVLDLERKFSLVLHQQTRNSDIVGRLERLKYMVLAPNTPPEGGVRLAERFTSFSLSRRVDGDFPLTFSAGVAAVEGQNGQVEACPELLLAAAGRALNEARAAGVAQVAVAWGTA
jgi:PleD family two-component response regulator